MKKIAIIEDEPDILEMIEHNLTRGGFCVCTALDGEAGLSLAKKESPDLILLDIMLPGLDGIEVCRALKENAATRRIPIIMLTAKSEESDIVLGLSLGADDYVTKPFSQKELLARIKAVLRRGKDDGETAKSERIVCGGVVIDIARHEVTVDGAAVAFTATELRLLYFLAAHPGRVFTRDILLNQAVGEAVYVVDRNIDVHIRAVRKKLGSHRDLIETIRGVGYRFSDGGA